MRLGRLGGLLILGSCGLFLVTLILALGGASVSVLGAWPGGVTVTVGLIAFAAGCLLVAIDAPAALHGRVVRLGLALVAIGVTCVVATSRVSISSMLVLVYLIGGAVAWLGVALAAIGLLRGPGRPRQLALAILAGSALVVASLSIGPALAGPDGTSPLRFVGAAIEGAGGILVLVGVAWLGLLSLDGRVAPPVGDGAS